MKPEADIGLEYIAWLQSQVEKHGGEILVAAQGGQAVGYAVILIRGPNEDDDEVAYDYAYVRDIAVTASQRGKGLGKRLLDACEQCASKAGAERLRISVLSQNLGARQLYTSFGFVERITEMEKALE